MVKNDLTPVWKALSDPTRRRILDLLREGRLTTGDICGQFEITRYGVMKHLKILEASGLVLVRKEGRLRWNYLNAVPIRQIYERWVSEFESHWAGSLLNLKRYIDKGERTDMNGSDELNSIHIEQSVTVKASPERVFQALTDELSAWWGAPYLISEEAVDIVLEPELNGRLYEVWGEGEGGMWARVTGIKRSELLELTGPIGMSGIVYARLTFALEAQNGGTVINLSHRAIGQVSEETQQGYDAGWKELVGDRLKAFVEDGERKGIKK